MLSLSDVAHLSNQSLGMDCDDRVLPSIGNEVLKSIVAQFDAAELITWRGGTCSCASVDSNALTGTGHHPV
jgi:hypothetical protein